MMRLTLVLFIFVVSAGVAHAQQSGQLLEILQQLTRLETEVRQLRGQVEQLTHENNRLKSQQNDLYVDLDQRMRTLETGGSSAAAGQLVVQPPSSQAIAQPSLPATPMPAPGAAAGASASQAAPVTVGQPTPAAPAVAVAPPVAPVDPAKEQADYKAAFNLLKVGKYDEAIVSYSEFLRKYPAGKYAANAQYWLGEANYVTRQFPVAIEEFKKVISNYPQSRKLPDAMLKIGYIHYELKQSDDARRVLSELTQQYPGTTAARLAENRLQRMKLEGR